MKKLIFSILLTTVAICAVSVSSAQVDRPQLNTIKKTIPYTFSQDRTENIGLNSIGSGPIQCIDTILYPQGKTTGLEIDTMYFGYVEGVSEAYYLTSPGLIHGIRAFVLLDTNTTSNDVAPLNMVIRVSNAGTLPVPNIPTTVITSNTVTVNDIGFQEQTFMFAAPVAVSGNFTVSIELDSSIPGRGAWYVTNASVSNDGGNEQLAGTLFAGIWYNFQAQFLPPWDIDHLVAPIFEQTINSTYTVNTDSICAGDSVVFTNSSTIVTDSMFNLFGTGSPIYQWDYNDGTGIYNHFDTAHTFNAGGTYNTQLLITNYGYTGNCVDSIQEIIEVFEPIVATSIDTIVCAGSLANLTATGATTYVWDNGLGAGQNQSFTPVIDTSYLVTGTSGPGCISTDTVFVALAPCNCVDTILYPQSKTTALELDTLYFGYMEGVAEAYYLTNNGLLYGARARVYLDTNATSNDVAPLNMILKVSNVDAINRPTSVIASNSVTVNDVGLQEQTFLFTVPVAVSGDFAVSIELDPTLPGRGAWYATNASVANDGANEQLAGSLFAGVWYNFQAQFLPPWDIDHLVSPIFDQTVSSSYTTSTDSICAGDSVVFTNTSILNTVDTMFTFNNISTPLYQWDYNDGTGIYSHLDTTYTFNTGGTYNTELIVTSFGYTGNCVDTSRQVIEVFQPVVIASVDTAICTGDTVFLSATGATTYTWDNGLGAGQNQTANPIIDTMYIVTGTSGPGCVALDTVNVTINALPIIIASNDTSVCSGDTVFLSATGAITYLWDNGLGLGQNQTANPIIDTMYVVTGTDGVGCIDTDTVRVIVNALPLVTASNDTTICAGDTATISANSTISIYTWDNGLGVGQTQQVTPSVLTSYIVSVSDGIGCAGFDTVDVTINALPVLTTNTDTTICNGDSITLFATGATSYTWDNGLGIGQTHLLLTPFDTTYIVVGLDGNGCFGIDSVVVTLATSSVIASIDTSICPGSSATISATGATSYTWDNGLGFGQTFVVNPISQTVYIVTGDDNGCISSDTVFISLDNLNCFDIPNVFTPNGDGKNDLWNIRGLELYPDITLSVFNRWGDLMFESAPGYPESWDGTYNGTESPEATYYYIIVLGDGEEGLTGTINIVR
jgi:gliding motility-associated-like protein